MIVMERELFINGFCKNLNQGRTVAATYEDSGEPPVLLDVDCSFENCEHCGSCKIAKRIRHPEF